MVGDTNELVSTIQARQLAAFWRCSRRTAVSCTCLAVCLFLEWLKFLCGLGVYVPSVVCTIIVYVFRGVLCKASGVGVHPGGGSKEGNMRLPALSCLRICFAIFFCLDPFFEPREEISAVFSPKSEH